MDSTADWVRPLTDITAEDADVFGGKAARLAQLAQLGYRTPSGFAIGIEAYKTFVDATSVGARLRVELGRKDLAGMRWEELWDTGLRIRNAFLHQAIPDTIALPIVAAFERWTDGRAVAVRSSGPLEDSASRSFAGLHESYINITDREALLDAVRLVWASLWSDAALLYKKELGLDPAQSRMAVVVQTMVTESVSGVAFGRDPRARGDETSIIEAVPGLCSALVDGEVDPDRWVIERRSGNVVEHRRGERNKDASALLDSADLAALQAALSSIETSLDFAPDLEWTGRKQRLFLLQARPITTGVSADDNGRAWYLTLRPSDRRLSDLRDRVVGVLIPALSDEGARFAAEHTEDLEDSVLANAIQARSQSLERWREVYARDFIPFAHGVRRFGTFYNDIVRPEDPHEFVLLLRGQQIIAAQRNETLRRLALEIAQDTALRQVLIDSIAATREAGAFSSTELQSALADVPGGSEFLDKLQSLEAEYMDVVFAGERLSKRHDLLIDLIIKQARLPHDKMNAQADQSQRLLELERKFLSAAADKKQAADLLATGRVSWQLRDDDNLLLGRIESQLLRAIEEGLRRLAVRDRCAEDVAASSGVAPQVVEALRNPEASRIEHQQKETDGESPHDSPMHSGRGRQLIGQPAAPGLASGRAVCIAKADDLRAFEPGDVLICDAIQPNMTHLVPLASAIVERRGGMLIHGAIIARELGIPCVNGIAAATERIPTGTLVTVDGHLGIVSLGPPDFSMELADACTDGERPPVR